MRQFIVTHCGSTKFGRAFDWANCQDTLAGQTVLTIGCVLQPDGPLFARYTPRQVKAIKGRLDQLHLRKIDMADLVRVINPTGYIGQSTLHELCYARNHGVPIQWLVDWPMYCPRCRMTGPESEHFFHAAISVSELERLLCDERIHPYLEGQMVEWLGLVAPVVRLDSSQFALQVDLPCPMCRKSHGTQYVFLHEGTFDGSVLLPDGRVINYYDADDRSSELRCPDCAAAGILYCFFTTRVGQTSHTVRIPIHALPQRLTPFKEFLLSPGFRQCQLTIGDVAYTITLDRGVPQVSTYPQLPLGDVPVWIQPQLAVEKIHTQQVQ